MMMLQVQTATDCTRYFQGVAGAVTSPPPPPPPSNRCQHGLITRHTRVSLQFPFLRLRFLRRPKITRGYFWSANALHALHFIQKELKHFRNPFIFIRYKLLFWNYISKLTFNDQFCDKSCHRISSQNTISMKRTILLLQYL